MNVFRVFSTLAVAGALNVLAMPSARAVEPLDFAKKVAVTPSATALAKIGESTFTDFPVLVRLPAAASAFLQSADGTDLFVMDENDAVLSFEVDTFASDGETLVWVKVPSLSASTKLTVYFGGTANQDNNPTNVWTDYVGVWHMNESSGTVADATGHGLGAAPANSTDVSVSYPDGVVGNARQTATYDVKDYLTIPNYNSQKAGSNFTFSCWYDATARRGWDRLVSRKTSHSETHGWEVEVQNDNAKVGARGASTTSVSAVCPDLVNSGWMRFAFVYDGTTETTFLNGEQLASGTINSATDNGLPLSIGCNSNGSEAYFVGYADEARLRKGAASAAEVALEHATMADAAFFTYGAVETVDSASQVFESPTVVRNANGSYTVSVVLSKNSGDVGVIYGDGATAVTNTIAQNVSPNTYTDTPANLVSGTTYAYAAYGRNVNGTEVVKKGGVFYNGDLAVTKVSDANEDRLVPGVFRIARADAGHDLTVAYTVGGTAAAGQTYAELSGTATIPAGASSVDVQVVPLNDPKMSVDSTVTVTLAAGLYGIDDNAASAELTIANLGAPAGFNTWIAHSAGLASVGSNWSENHCPTDSENVLFDGRFSSADCEWDAEASATVASWTQTNGYSGIVTLKTVYPGKGEFQCLTVNGPMAIQSGTITHPLSRKTGDNIGDNTLTDLLNNETYRIRIDAASLVVGADGRIDACNKGYYQSNTGSNICPEPSHGGRFSASGQAPYDDVKEPIHIGMPYKRSSGTWTVGIGGGAVYLTSAGAIVVDGYVGADTGSDTWNLGYVLRGGAAAGSVYVRGASVTGTGTISASALKTAEQNDRGVGGRVAVIATSSTPIDYSTLQLKATVYPFNNNHNQSSTYGGCGTVYVKDGTMDKGVLIVRNFDLNTDEGNPGRRTDVTSEGDWTFDRLELGGGVQLTVPHGTTLKLPGWDCVTAPYNTSGAPSGLYYRGGTLDFGSASDVTLSGRWHFAPVSNYLFNANVTLAGGAMIGFGGSHTQGLANNAHPVNVDRIHCTVNGDLTVPSDCSIDVNMAGAMQDSNGFLDDYPLGSNGGRSSNEKVTVGSVFHPQTLPHGQSNSYGHIVPGGAVELAVSGTLTLGGSITATAYTGNDGIRSVSGGSIDISAGRLVGAGSINAGSVKGGQTGGRIAIRLSGADATVGDFEGTINCATKADSGSCGSIYVQNAADGERRGTIILDDNNVATTIYTPICATGYEADDVADFRGANLVVRNKAWAQVMAADAKNNFTMGNVVVDETGKLDLFGHVFMVKSARFGGVKLQPGSYTANSDMPIGNKTLGDYLVDTSDGASGSLVITGGGFAVIMR